MENYSHVEEKCCHLLVALETLLGCTLMGKMPQKSTSEENLALAITSLFVKEAEISDL